MQGLPDGTYLRLCNLSKATYEAIAALPANTTNPTNTTGATAAMFEAVRAGEITLLDILHAEQFARHLANPPPPTPWPPQRWPPPPPR